MDARKLLENVRAEERALAARRSVNRQLREIRDERRALLAEDGTRARKSRRAGKQGGAKQAKGKRVSVVTLRTAAAGCKRKTRRAGK